MYRLLLILFVLSAALAATPARAQSEAELAGAALTAADLPPGFELVQAGPAGEAVPGAPASHLAVFQRFSLGFPITIDFLTVLLADGASFDLGDSATVETALAEVRGHGLEVTPVEAPAIGTETARFALSGAVAGVPLRGDVIIWRYGRLIVSVATVGTRMQSAEGYALRQQEKLVAAFGY
jgi:hypothetical protein